MGQEVYRLDLNNKSYKKISKILLISSIILFIICFLDTILFSDKVQRVLHYLDMIELVSFFILSILLSKELEVHALNKATSITIGKNFAAFLVFAVIGFLYIQMCIQIFDLPGANPIYYLFIGLGSIVYAVAQFITGVIYNKMEDKLLNQRVNEKAIATVRTVNVCLNALALLLYLIGVIFFEKFSILSFLRVFIRTICFILIIYLEPLYLKCFKKEALYDVQFK